GGWRAGSRVLVPCWGAADGRQRMFVFARGADGHLYANVWDGYGWSWADQGRPASTPIDGDPGGVTVMDTPTSPQRPYAFVRGADGHLYQDYWTGSSWGWYDMGSPDTAPIDGNPGVVTVMDTPTSAQRPYAFARGADGHLYVDYWTGSSWGWADQGSGGSGSGPSSPGRGGGGAPSGSN